MADRVKSGEFRTGSAALSPTTASMGISRGAIQRQIRVMDPEAHATRVKERVRVESESAEAAAIGHAVEFVFVERGSSASAKKGTPSADREAPK